MGEQIKLSPVRTSQEFKEAYLHAADFDGTMFDTFEEDSSRGIYGVDEAYKTALEKTFYFDQDALKRYEDQGEHNNRTPLEIVKSLAPRATPEGLAKLTDALVKEKLAILEDQIGKPLVDGEPWPRPLPGFLDYSSAVAKANRDGERIDRAVLSAGHASFIRKCLASVGVEPPEILVTDETIRGLSSDLPPEKLAKPSLMPLSLAKIQWASLYDTSYDEHAAMMNQRITIIGDSPEKDGGLAANAGLRFIHVTAENAAESWKALLHARQLGGQAVAAAL